MISLLLCYLPALKHLHLYKAIPTTMTSIISNKQRAGSAVTGMSGSRVHI
jgi:hypothetical protein